MNIHAADKFSLVLIHSPLIGPFAWQPTADYLAQRGHSVIIPDLVPALDHGPSFSHAFSIRVRDAIREVPSDESVVLVAHSAAGAYLPIIASSLAHQVGAYIFLDARLPTGGGSLSDQDSPGEQEQREHLAKEGVLPNWSDWFEKAAIREAIPWDDLRREFVSELRPIPLTLFDEKLIVPGEWPDAPCGYLRLSEAYHAELQNAKGMDWVALERDGNHLDILTDPEMVAEGLVELITQVIRRPDP